MNTTSSPVGHLTKPDETSAISHKSAICGKLAVYRAKQLRRLFIKSFVCYQVSTDRNPLPVLCVTTYHLLHTSDVT